jgi:outer membrane protein assembly factor BamB
MHSFAHPQLVGSSRVTVLHRRCTACMEIVALLVLLVGCGNPSPSNAPPVLSTPLTLPPGATTPTVPAAKSSDWITYHHDNTRTGYLTGESDPQRLTRAWNTSLDGAVYAEPLVVGDRVLVATEGNSLYAALDADTGSVRATVPVGQTSRFATPTLSGGYVFVGTLTGAVAIARS